MKSKKQVLTLISSLGFFLCIAVTGAQALYSQTLDRIDRGRAKDMLKAVKNEIKENYYDPAFRGIDLDARFKMAEEKLDKATSLTHAFGIIAQAVVDLNDSHTTFYPPSLTAVVQYGWRMQMIGEKCFVSAVRPRSNAEKNGLRAGDEIISIEGFRPKRNDLWKIQYYYNVLSPKTSMKVVVKSPRDEESRELNIAAKVKTLKTKLGIEDLIRQTEIDGPSTIENRFVSVGGTTAWKMPTFSVDPSLIPGIIGGKLKRFPNLIIDLRGNGGGYVVTLEALAGFFVDKDTKIADLKGRKEFKPMLAKTKGSDVYKGRLIVLVDSKSASASEIFARFVQLTGRGIVLGDTSAGAVMMSRFSPMSLGAESIVPYGMSVTHADVIMTDGKSLEHVGVSPNAVLIPSGDAISKGHDPVLSEAFKLLGEDISPEQAGKFFPPDWKDDE